MSNGLAFATVTQALALLIANNLRPEIDIAVTVDTRRPPAEPPTEPTINIFLYQVTPNASLRTTDLPTRASDGTLLKRPAAAMDLHYLISAYGEESELVGQRLIGTVVRILHEIPMLPKDVIEEAARRPYLTGSDLADAVQRVRFTPTQMDVDETSKLWGMLYQTPYVLSVCYQGSLVLIEGRERPVPAKPVERSTVRVLPFGAPGAPEPPTLPGAERPEEPAETEASTEASTEVSTEAETPSPVRPAKKRPAAAKTAAAKTAKAAKSAVSPARTRKSTPRRRGGRSEDTES
ncbi:DUF4255 domain-containing protein [Streptomyces iranensis]|uniref:Pvc16 N-terminal domain-containing protein n=1 Tax=Streptomyces iranensis TaxID=576784 RepID=A0A061AAD2_9ACTN|nr:DUF4255 domain-containing protein [Streptomyces iranensis]MBP2060288.1 hypothetical protein [Streptomyces iranensis]CDR15916.1 predicted protein [Streptomyces iranensis]